MCVIGISEGEEQEDEEKILTKIVAKFWGGINIDLRSLTNSKKDT
jgi:hypothetical protein